MVVAAMITTSGTIMSHISVQRDHNLGHQQARQAAEKVAGQLKEHYGMQYHWEDDTLHFERPGVDGQMDVGASEVRVDVRLGLFLLPMKHRFEQEIHRYMDELFEQV